MSLWKYTRGNTGTGGVWSYSSEVARLPEGSRAHSSPATLGGFGLIPSRNSLTVKGIPPPASSIAWFMRGGVSERGDHWIAAERPDYSIKQLLRFFRAASSVTTH